MSSPTPPDLEKRFQQPAGWQWHYCEHRGRSIRVGFVSPRNNAPDALVICLQGVREFCEKYYEVARWCIDRNLGFLTFDWVGQGKSARYLSNLQKRHSAGFDRDVGDLHVVITKYAKGPGGYSSGQSKDIPLVMLAHSMGANLGLRYIHQHPTVFDCAAFSAPLIGIQKFENLPQVVALAAAFLCRSLFGRLYIPGGGNWGQKHETGILSSDPIRNIIDEQWCTADPALQCGDVTFRWVYEAQRSCMALQKPSLHTTIETPCLFGIAAREHLVDNDMAKKIIAGIKNSKFIDYLDSFHEILMEKDEIRDDFLDNFYRLINEVIIEAPPP